MKKPLVVILAGGIGSSFYPLATDKTLVPFLGKPLLAHAIEMIESAGFHEALIITNPVNETWLASYQPFNITLRTCVVQPKGMAGALLQAEDEIGSDPILVVNGCDLISQSFFKDLGRKSISSYAFVTGQVRKKYFPGGYLAKDGSRAVGIVEKPGAGNEPSDLFKLALDYFSEPQEFFSQLKKLPPSDDQYELGLAALMKERHVDLLTYDGPWQKLKYPHHVLHMTAHLLNTFSNQHISRSAYVSPHALIEGNVFIDEDAHIDAFAVIKGPTYIGRRARVGNHALVRNATVEEDAIVGFGSEVVRSYIGPRCALHQNFVGDTVLEADVNPSWGTTFANWRLDKKPITVKRPDGQTIHTDDTKLGAIVAKGAFLGVNCSVMPGVTIGAGKKIFPGSVVKESV